MRRTAEDWREIAGVLNRSKWHHVIRLIVRYLYHYAVTLSELTAKVEEYEKRISKLEHNNGIVEKVQEK